MGRQTIVRLAPGIPKYLQIKQLLEERVRHLPAETQLPSIAELRGEFGVALGTLDRAVQELRREGVIDVRHGSGIYSTGRQKTMQIGICFGFDVLEPDAGAFPRLLLRGLANHEAENPSVVCRHYFAAGTGQYWATRFDLLERDVRAHLVDAVIVIGVFYGDLGDLAVPIVGLHAVPDVTARVQLDYADLVRKGVRALAARGCRRLAYAGGHQSPLPPEGDPTRAVALEHDRARQEFRREVRRLGLTTADPWVQGQIRAPGGAIGVSAAILEGRSAWRAIRAAGQPLPDGIVSTDDCRTLGLCDALAEQRLRPGSDVHLATLANRGSTVLGSLPVTRLELDPDDVAAALIGTSIRLINDRLHTPATTYVRPKVIHP